MTNEVFENNKSNITLLLKLIDSYRQEQSLSEHNTIQEDVKNGDWQTVKTSHGNTFFVDKQKYQDMKREDLDYELKHVSVLADFGLIVYLVRENHTKQNIKSIDTIVNGIRIELKYIQGTRATAGKSYDRGLSKSPHISMYFAKSVKDSEESYSAKLVGTAKESAYPKGILINYYEKTEKLIVKDMNIVTKNMEHHAGAPGWQGVSALHNHSVSHTQKKSMHESDNFDIGR